MHGSTRPRADACFILVILQIAKASGCAITTRGQYITPQQRGYMAAKPLHLHLEATNPQAVAKADALLRDLLFPQKTDPVAMAKQLASSLTSRYVGSAPEPLPFSAEVRVQTDRGWRRLTGTDRD